MDRHPIEEARGGDRAVESTTPFMYRGPFRTPVRRYCMQTRRLERSTGGWMDAWMHGCMDAWVDGQTCTHTSQSGFIIVNRLGKPTAWRSQLSTQKSQQPPSSSFPVVGTRDEAGSPGALVESRAPTQYYYHYHYYYYH